MKKWLKRGAKVVVFGLILHAFYVIAGGGAATALTPNKGGGVPEITKWVDVDGDGWGDQVWHYAGSPTAPVNPCAGITNFVDCYNGKPGQVWRLYSASFNRLPDPKGFSDQLAAASRGVGLGELSSRFGGSEEFRLRYGTLDNEDFVFMIYNNVLGRFPDFSGFVHWTTALDEGKISRSDLMVGFSESPENVGFRAFDFSLWANALALGWDFSRPVLLYVEDILGVGCTNVPSGIPCDTSTELLPPGNIQK